MKLPNGEREDVGSKLQEYVLNVFHRQGQHKARAFDSVVGIRTDNAEILRMALLDVAPNSDVATYKGDNGHGDIYEIRFSLTTEKGAPVILRAWIIQHGED